MHSLAEQKPARSSALGVRASHMTPCTVANLKSRLKCMSLSSFYTNNPNQDHFDRHVALSSSYRLGRRQRATEKAEQRQRQKPP